MLVEHLKHGGTSHSSSDLLKICVKMGASLSAQVLRQAGDTPCDGAGAFLLLFSLKTWRMSSSLIFSVGKRGVAGGVIIIVGRDVQNGVGCISKSTVKVIKIVGQLLILQSGGGWYLVNRNVFQTFPH